MKFSYNFDSQKLEAMLKRALLTWGVKEPSITLSYSSTEEKASASVSYRVRQNIETLSLGHEVIVQAIAIASQADGNPIDIASLKFTKYEGSRHSRGSMSATAEAGERSSANEQKPGKVNFPGKATKQLGAAELKKVLEDGARRAGYDVSHVSIYHSKDGPASATIDISRNGSKGTFSLNPAELDEAIVKEMGHRGYDIVAGATTYSTTSAGFGGGGGTNATLTLTGIPV